MPRVLQYFWYGIHAVQKSRKTFLFKKRFTAFYVLHVMYALLSFSIRGLK
jgi:hypothetical protein